MRMRRVLGPAAIGAVLVFAVPAERASALSLANPGAAAAIQENSKQTTTDVRWYHRGWHRHHRCWRCRW